MTKTFLLQNLNVLLCGKSSIVTALALCVVIGQTQDVTETALWLYIVTCMAIYHILIYSYVYSYI